MRSRCTPDSLISVQKAPAVDLTEKLEVRVTEMSNSLHHDQTQRSEMQQLREMVSYQTGLITGLHATCSSLVTTITTLYEVYRSSASHSEVQAMKRRRINPEDGV